MGPSSSCSYTNQGQTIGDIKNEINNNMVQYNDNRYSVYYDINNNYFPNLSKLYGDNNDSNIINKYPTITDGNKVTLTLYNGSNSYKVEELRFKSSNPGIIEKIHDLNTNYEGQIKELNKTINNLLTKINDKYGSINPLIASHDSKIKDINTIKGNIINQSYSVSFFENLLIESYKHLYDAINTENKVLLNNKSIKFDMYSTDNSRYLYEIDKVKFYENINTFLFYFYYLLIIIFLIVVLKYNYSSMLVKLTFFRIFAVLLILYPLFILRIQDYIYKLFGYLYSFHIFDINIKNQPLDINIKPK
uniref:Uncharacterized protein n=1 Tax=viral metagenome TaxID=1070528 RepID=A0A6C0HUS1_9ZZZZ